MRRFTVAVAAALAACALMGSPAFAKERTKATVPFLKGNATCGGKNGGAVIGKIELSRLAGNSEYLESLQLYTLSIKKASPDTLYELQFWTSSPCELWVQWPEKFETNSKGDYSLEGVGSLSTLESQLGFFATLVNLKTHEYNDTPSFYLAAAPL